MNKLIKILIFATSCLFSATGASTGNMDNGKKLFELHCVQCHQPGQEITTLQTTSIRDSLMQPDSVLREKILSGINAMPGYYGLLNDREIANILLYMRMVW